MSIGQADGRPDAEPGPRSGPSGPTGSGSDRDGGRQRDEAFAELLRGGDVAAFALLFDAWADPIYDRISHRGFTTADVSRIESDAFVATHRRIVQQGAIDPFRVLILRSTSQAMSAHETDRVDLRLPVGPYAEDRLTRSAEVRTLATDPAVVSFLWEAADVLGLQVREVLDLHYRFGLTNAEVAAIMQETTASIDAILSKVEAGYNAVVRSRIMWRQGGPTHDALAQVVAGHRTFDTSVVKLVAEHLRTCQECRDASQVPVRPIAVFAAIPLSMAPPGFKEGVVENLTASGVDMKASASTRRTATAATAASAAEIVGAVEIATPPNPSTGAGALGLDAGMRGGEDRDVAARGVARKPAKGRSGRKEDAAAAATGLAVGLAAFAGPIDAPDEAAVATPAGADASPEAALDATPAYAPVPDAPGEGSDGPVGQEPPSSGSRKGWLLAAAAAAVVVIVLAVVVLGGSGSKHPAKVAIANSHQSTTTVSPTTLAAGTATTAAPSTTVAVTVTTAAGSSTSTSTSTTAKGSPATTIVTKTTGGNGVTTTTAVPFPTVNLSFVISGQNPIAPNPSTGGWDETNSGAPRAQWTVTASGPITVTMSGPNLSSTSTSANPGVLLCPGNLGGSTGTICTTAAGSYHYTITVKDNLNRVVRTQTLSLIVN